MQKFVERQAQARKLKEETNPKANYSRREEKEDISQAEYQEALKQLHLELHSISFD